MVNTDIPKNYTASPSSFNGTPQLIINREAALDLDSSNSFEGPEKLLEVWFAPSAVSLPASALPGGLKAVDSSVWTPMLDLVHCKVLSVVESDAVDAYLLSESSMFVFPHKLVLKTCGITTLISGLPKILEIAATFAGFPTTTTNSGSDLTLVAATHRVFYSRKNFLYPDRQRGPHRSWRDEVRALDRYFHGGSAYMIGKMNGDHWYLYITEPDLATPTIEPQSSTITNGNGTTHPEKVEEVEPELLLGNDAEDETLELLMTDLDEENAKQFYLDHASAVAEGKFFQDLHKARRDASDALGKSQEEKNPNESSFNGSSLHDVFGQTSDILPDSESRSLPAELTTEGHALGTVVSDASGLADVYPTSKYPEARIDAYLFTPCGFSANGVIPAPENDGQKSHGSPASTHYFTVHVTPEPQCSYASFETNVPARQTGRETAEVVEQVVNIFKPGRFSVTLFEAKAETLNDVDLFREAQKKNSRMETISGYRRVDRIVHDLDGYDLVFRYFERHDWKGGAPRLGEFY